MSDAISDIDRCRSCFTDPGTISLFSKENDVEFAEMFFWCTSIKVCDLEYKKICTSCLNQLRNSYGFRKQCIESKERFQTLNYLKQELKLESSVLCEWPAFDGYLYIVPSPSNADVNLLTKDEKEVACLKKEVFINVSEETNSTLAACKEVTRKKIKSIGRKINVLSRKKRNMLVNVEEDCVKGEVITKENSNNTFFSDNRIKEKSTKPKGRFECDICGHATNLKATLITHINSKHSEERPYECKECNKRFKIKNVFKRHIELHTGIRSFVCDVCGHGSGSKFLLDVHHRIHSGELPYACEICGKKFRASYSLRNHQRRHLKNTTKSCEICGKSFYDQGSLTLHRRVHTGEQPYLCSLCPKKFKGQSNLTAHMKIHLGHKDFACPYCEKSFNLKASMLIHSSIHTGIPHFKCKVCDTRFSRRHDLQIHHASCTQNTENKPDE